MRIRRLGVDPRCVRPSLSDPRRLRWLTMGLASDTSGRNGANNSGVAMNGVNTSGASIMPGSIIAFRQSRKHRLMVIMRHLRHTMVVQDITADTPHQFRRRNRYLSSRVDRTGCRTHRPPA